VGRAVRRPRTGGSEQCPLALRERWRVAALAAGWPFPDDWGVPAVDAVCEAATDGRDPTQALGRLGRARAESGAGLDETLRDLATLYVVVSATGRLAGPGTAATTDGASSVLDHVPPRLLRATALGWADVVAGERASTRVVDELTGLTTAGYLRTRLAEVYRYAEVDGHTADERHVLVVLALDLTRAGGWSRLLPMLMAAEAMRAVFDGGETLTLLTPSVAVILAGRDERLALRSKRLRRLATELVARDPDSACVGPVRIWLEQLPSAHPAACDLLAHLGR